MNHGPLAPDVKDKIIFALQRRIQSEEGWYDAINFALIREQVEDEPQIRYRYSLKSDEVLRSMIEDDKSALLADPERAIRAIQDRDLSTLRKKEYLGALVIIAEIYSSEVVNGFADIPGVVGIPLPPARYLACYGYLKGGTAKGFQFALECNLDIPSLEAEIQNARAYIASGHDSMRLGASPRIHEEGYLSGLIEAIDIIKRNVES